MRGPTLTPTSTLLKQEVIGSRRFSTLWWAFVSSLGGIGFLLAGLSSYLGINLLRVSDTSQLQFIPQGVALTFYGVAGCLVALYQWLTWLWDVGGGFNEFDKTAGRVTLFRWGFPGKNRRIEFSHAIADVLAVRADIKEGINPKRALYLKVKQHRDIPLTRAGQPISLAQLENQGAELARFLGVPLEGL
jgi:hypothetical protein